MIVVAGEALVDLVIDTQGAVIAKLGGGPYNVARTDPPTTLAAAELDEHGSATYRFSLQSTSAPSLREVPAASEQRRRRGSRRAGAVLSTCALGSSPSY